MLQEHTTQQTKIQMCDTCIQIYVYKYMYTNICIQRYKCVTHVLQKNLFFRSVLICPDLRLYELNTAFWLHFYCLRNFPSFGQFLIFSETKFIFLFPQRMGIHCMASGQWMNDQRKRVFKNSPI